MSMIRIGVLLSLLLWLVSCEKAGTEGVVDKLDGSSFKVEKVNIDMTAIGNQIEKIASQNVENSKSSGDNVNAATLLLLNESVKRSVEKELNAVKYVEFSGGHIYFYDADNNKLESYLYEIVSRKDDEVKLKVTTFNKKISEFILKKSPDNNKYHLRTPITDIALTRI